MSHKHPFLRNIRQKKRILFSCNNHLPEFPNKQQRTYISGSEKKDSAWRSRCFLPACSERLHGCVSGSGHAHFPFLQGTQAMERPRLLDHSLDKVGKGTGASSETMQRDHFEQGVLVPDEQRVACRLNLHGHSLPGPVHIHVVSA
jgi:hypothetical protein